MTRRTVLSMLLASPGAAAPSSASSFQVTEDAERILIRTPALEAAVRKRGNVSGVARGSFLDRKTGVRDPGGLDLVDRLLEPGSDLEYRLQLPPELTYPFDNLAHGKSPRRVLEAPGFSTGAGPVALAVIRGRNFVAVTSKFKFSLTAFGRKPGSVCTQTLLFPASRRYFLACDEVRCVNDYEAPLLRVDLPGDIEHRSGDTFSEIYLNYAGLLTANEFLKDFAPDTKFDYRRDRGQIPQRFIRACHLRDPGSGKEGPWLAGMALNPSDVYEAWCYQRGHVSMILDFGGRPVAAGKAFRTAFITGFFDSVEEMEDVYDRYAGSTALEVDEDGWQAVSSTKELRDRIE